MAVKTSKTNDLGKVKTGDKTGDKGGGRVIFKWRGVGNGYIGGTLDESRNDK
jgi:hypothetical protein